MSPEHGNQQAHVLQFSITWDGFAHDETQKLQRIWANFAFPDRLCALFRGRVLKGEAGRAFIHIDSDNPATHTHFLSEITYTSLEDLILQLEHFTHEVAVKDRRSGRCNNWRTETQG